ncbi:MAG: LysR substrate-binding domain-containing protein [Casimicrobiaceae bacterium]
MGIVLEPDFIVTPALQSGALVALLAGYAPASANIYAVYASRRHLSATVRACVDYLVGHFGRGPPPAM